MPDPFTDKDIQQLRARGVTIEQALSQVETLRRGVPYTRLLRPCTPGDGITLLDQDDRHRLAAVYTKAALSGRAVKFVPASGAASRMFQALVSVKEQLDRKSDLTPEAQKDLERFTRELRKFAFYEDLNSVMSRAGLDTSILAARGEASKILRYLLTDMGLNYGSLCKGLIKFHLYADHCRTPFEEHLVEAAAYLQDRNKVARVHFTVPAEQRQLIEANLQAVRGRYQQSGVEIEIGYSIQKPSTDTLALYGDDQLVRDKNGELLFRPGGHGALLENLGELEGGMIFIKNIDNIVPDRLKEQTHHYKKALAGLLVELQDRIFGYLKDLSKKDATEELLGNAMEFTEKNLSMVPLQQIQQGSKEQKRRYIIDKLNRPLRVCGMVPSTGAPGGGPFWVIRNDREVSLQIVESSQVDMQSKEQRRIWADATHFNPVDIVCGIRDFQGKPFDLMRFRDPSACFISAKSIEGKPLKALEHPGLWNGGMADWNTVFVEVPLATFNPVKTVFDLLETAHQSA